MKNDFSKSAIRLLIFNFVCADIALIGATASRAESYDDTLLKATMGAIWGQFALACAARLRFPDYRSRTSFWLLGIPLFSVAIYPLLDSYEPWWLMPILILLAFAITSVVCLAPATILLWLYGQQGRQVGIKHLLVFTCLFAVFSFAFSQLDFAGSLLLAFTLFALPSIIACVLLSLPDRPELYSVSMMLFLLFAWGTLQVRDVRILEESAEIFYAQVICLWFGGQFLMAGGRSEPQGLDRPEVADDIEPI